MPKVTEEHRQQRREQILLAAWRLFATNGFHSTSMAEVIRASGLSAGAVYLYFSSKEDLIRAIAEKSLGTAQSVTGAILADPTVVSPGTALEMLGTRLHDIQGAADGRLFPVAMQAWAEAVRNPAIAEVARRFFAALNSDMVRIIERWSEQGHPMVAAPQHLARMVAGVLQGYVVQQASFGVPWEPEYLALLGRRVDAMIAAPDPGTAGDAEPDRQPAGATTSSV